MKTKWLFPHSYRLVGWLIFVPSTVMGLILNYMGFELNWLDTTRLDEFLKHTFSVWSTSFASNQNLTDEVAAVGVIVGLLLIAFSREKVEDEMIGRLRLEALQWSVYANYIILIIAILTVYDTAFFSVMVYNMFTVLLVFIARFRWLLHRNANLLLV